MPVTRLRATLALGLVLAAVLAVAGAVVRVPYVALGDGPTFDVLGSVDGRTVVDVAGPVPTFPTTGQLRMTTVSVTSQVTLFGAMAMWASGSRQVVPRETVYPPGQSRQEVDAENTRQFTQSEDDATTAALRFLGAPSQVEVADVTPNGPAAARLGAGDRILAADGRAVATPSDLVAAVGALPPGTPVTLRVQRGDGVQDVTVVLGARPDDPTRGFLGVVPSAAVLSPARIDISLADVGGPSAGLVFATAVIDKLTPGALTGGRVVAGTGTITADGAVGPIGGIRFKLDAARADGASVFLVPADNCSEAAATAPSGLELVRVERLADAVGALQALDTGGTPVGCGR